MLAKALIFVMAATTLEIPTPTMARATIDSTKVMPEQDDLRRMAISCCSQSDAAPKQSWAFVPKVSRWIWLRGS